MNVYDKITRYGWAGLSSEAGQSAGGDVFYIDEADVTSALCGVTDAILASVTATADDV